MASIAASRVAIVVGVALALGSYLLVPATVAAFLLDLVLRTYVHFALGALAHEGTHGHLGSTAASNRWWSRLALLPIGVTAVGFRKTHLQHHRFTNEPERDPDAFLETPRRWQIPLRAIAMPHHWILWLVRQRRFTGSDAAEYALTYVIFIAVHGGIAWFVGVDRVLLSFLPAAVLHSLVLWYPFAIGTHAGYSTGAPETRSHNYESRILFWLTFGLSLHRVHHLRPQLGWLQMAAELPRQRSWWSEWTFARDRRLSAR